MSRSVCAYGVLLVGATLLAPGCAKERIAPPSSSALRGDAGHSSVVVQAQAEPPSVPTSREGASPDPSAAPPSKRSSVDVSVQDFKALLEAVATCEVTGRGIDRDCLPYRDYRLAKARRGPIERPWKHVDTELAQLLITHQDAAVRYVAMELMGPLTRATSEQLAPLVEATRNEVHPGVLKQCVKRLGPSTYRHSDVRALMVLLAAHPDERVRIEVANWLTAREGRGMAELLERAMRMVRDDPSERVRLRVLEDLGDSGDERALPLLEPYLSSSKTSPRMHASAVRALINMWSSPIPHITPSQRAYARTLRLLRARPRGEDSPPWAALGGLRWVTKAPFQSRAPWFDMTQLIEALEALILDPKASLKVRSVAAELLVHYRVDKARLSALLERCTALAQGEGSYQGVIELLRAASAAPELTE